MRKLALLFVVSIVVTIVCWHFAAQAPSHQVFLDDGTPATQVDLTPWVAGALVGLALAAMTGWKIWKKAQLELRLDAARSHSLPRR